MITFNGDVNVWMGQVRKQRLLKLSVKRKAQIPKRLVAAFNPWLCKYNSEQQIPFDTCWQWDPPCNHFTLSLSGKAVTGLQVIYHDSE